MPAGGVYRQRRRHHGGGAATAIGSATGNYTLGQQALFVVDNGANGYLYLFKSNGTDAAVSAAELTQIAVLTGNAATSVADYQFVALSEPGPSCVHWRTQDGFSFADGAVCPALKTRHTVKESSMHSARSRGAATVAGEDPPPDHQPAPEHAPIEEPEPPKPPVKT
jgi:hypothetical protein